MEIKNYTKANLKNKTAVRADVKARSIEYLKEMFTKAIGEENVSLVRVGSDTETTVIAAVVGTILDKDGFEQEICITVDPVVKPWEDSVGEKRVIEKFDRIEAEENYKRFLKEKEEKAKSKANKNKAKGDK